MYMNIVFFGSSKFVIPIIEVLQKNCNLKLVVTTERNPTDAVPSYCIKNKINYISLSNLSDHNTKYLILNTESPAAILADFGLIIPASILNLFPEGIVNIHPSLLPKYRGPTPVQTAILNGDQTTGVTIIRLDNEVDHGPILSQTEEKILPNDTAESLYQRLFKIGAGSIVSTIEPYLKGKIKPKEQDHSKATFTNHLSRQDGYLDLKMDNGELKMENMIRAYFPWPGVWFKTKLNGKEKVIKLLPNPNYSITQLLNYSFLIQVEGKKPMSYKDFINGYPNLPDVMLNLFQHLS